MSIHIIYRDALNCDLDENRQMEIVEKFSSQGLEVAAIRAVQVEGVFNVQLVLFGDDAETARHIVSEIADQNFLDDIFLESLPDEEDRTEVHPS
jgi:hypothetical protein